ncbi:MAG: SCO family protein [Pseudomonadota bacterium]
MAEQRIDASVSHVSPARRRGLKAAVAGTAGLLGLPLLVTSLAGCDGKNFNPLTPSAAKFNGVDITGADYAKALSLTDPEGKRRSLAEFKGKVVVVFFGFTQCPDVCPTTMAELAEVRRRLGADGDRVQGVFVTVDPERDSAVVLGEYVKALDPSLVGLRGSVDEVTQAARDFKVFFQKVPSKDGQSYTMDHTAGSYVFDPDGKVRLFLRYGLGVDAWVADIKQLLQGPAAKA